MKFVTEDWYGIEINTMVSGIHHTTEKQKFNGKLNLKVPDS